jgi:adenosylcobinamide-GDP ribazoletransferase
MAAEKPPRHTRTARPVVPEASKADPMSEVEPPRDLPREAWLAASACVPWIPSPYPDGAAFAGEHSRGLVFVPAVGLIVGVVLALCDRALGAMLPALGASAITMMLAVLLSGGLLQTGLARTVAALIAGKAGSPTRASGWTGMAAAMLTLAAEVAALGAIANPPARARALVLALLLSRWAIVPVGYGLKPLEQKGLGIPYFGGITFTEFGISSVLALGLAMGLYDIVGLAAIVAVALTILGLRLLLSRRIGGVGGNALAASTAVCELITLAVLASISRI